MNKEKKRILEDYIKYRSLRNHSKTIKDIEFHIKSFIEFNKKPLDEFSEKTLLDYLGHITPKYKINMLNNVKSSYLKNFIKWYFTDWSSKFRNLDQLCKTEKANATYTPDDMIKEEDFQKIIKAEESHFWKAYFLTLFYGACRPNEVCSLKWSDVEFSEDGAYITIYSAKNKRSFIKFVPSDVAFYLKELKDNGYEYVFVNKNTKKPISIKGAYWKIGELSQRVLGKKIDLYTLRHSIATIIYNKDNIKDSDIAEQMGHTKSMKGKYVHNNKERLKELAKSIYVVAENLPPEKKAEYDKQIAELKEKMAKHDIMFDNFRKEMIKGYEETRNKYLDIAEAKKKNPETKLKDIEINEEDLYYRR